MQSMQQSLHSVKRLYGNWAYSETLSADHIPNQRLLSLPCSHWRVWMLPMFLKWEHLHVHFYFERGFSSKVSEHCHRVCLLLLNLPVS